MATKEPWHQDPRTLRHIARRIREHRRIAQEQRRNSDDKLDKEYWAGEAALAQRVITELTEKAKRLESKRKEG